MPRGSGPGVQTVIAAQQGDEGALDNLLSEYLPLIYNIVGRALNGHADVDDVVQETMLRVVRGVRDLRDPGAFRSWLVAVAVRQLHDHRQARQAAPLYGLRPEVADPGADFVDLTLLRLGLSGQRQETAQATRWLDATDRELLALWWLEAGGELDRSEIAAALGLPPGHVAVRIARMKEQLTTARVVIRALQAVPLCGGLASATADWDHVPSPLWRKRIARHARDCRSCGRHYDGLIPAERLLAGLPLVPTMAAAGRSWLLGRGLARSHSSQAQSPGRQASSPGRPASSPGRQAPSPGGQARSHGRQALHRAATGSRHGRILAKAAGSVPPKLVAVTLAASCAVAGTFALVHAHRARPAALAGHPAAASPAAPPSPVTAVIARPDPSPSPRRAPVAATASAPTAAANAKKGVSAWTFTGVDQALAESGVSWYYTWSSSHAGITSPPGVQFVPMIWGPGSVNAATLSQAKDEGHILLGFNEPDMSSQSNMTVSQALSLWPQLMATGMSLGSPAVAVNAATPGGWLDQFMRGAAARGYRVNFITVHWYGADFTTGPAVQQLESYLQAIYARYHLPIWLTEFALANFGGVPSSPTESQQAAFVTQSTSMLESLPYVQRYAWFALPSSATGGSTGLFASGAVATPVGRAFEAVDSAH
jgi:RNA polymerase sigma factor (sigma-70 family)